MPEPQPPEPQDSFLAGLETLTAGQIHKIDPEARYLLVIDRTQVSPLGFQMLRQKFQEIGLKALVVTVACDVRAAVALLPLGKEEVCSSQG